MVVLSRKKNEAIVINDNIIVTVVEIRGDKVRLGIENPKEIPVHRQEVYDEIQRNHQQAVTSGRQPVPRIPATVSQLDRLVHNLRYRPRPIGSRHCISDIRLPGRKLQANAEGDILTRLGRRPPQPHPTHHANVADTYAMKDLRGGAPPPRRLLERHGDREIEAPGDGVGERRVKQVDIIDNLRPQRGALLLLHRPDVVAVRELFAKADGELPPPAIQKTPIVRTGTFTTSTLHANHGRALTGGNSTLRPGMLGRYEDAKQDQKWCHQGGTVQLS